MNWMVQSREYEEWTVNFYFSGKNEWKISTKVENSKGYRSFWILYCADSMRGRGHAEWTFTFTNKQTKAGIGHILILYDQVKSHCITFEVNCLENLYIDLSSQFTNCWIIFQNQWCNWNLKRFANICFWKRINQFV